MASNFSDGPAGPDRRPDEEPRLDPGADQTPAGGSDETAPALSPAVERFRACRWRRPPEDGPECCTHRDVLPIAGTSGFKPEAWCPDCQYFKARRAPRRKPDPARYW